GVERHEARPLDVPMRLLGLVHEVDTVSKSRVQDDDDIRTGHGWKIILRGVHAFSPFEVMRAWSLSGAQECSRVRGISCCRGDRATRVPGVKPGHAPTTTLCFCMGKYRKSPQGNTSRSVRFSDTRTGERPKFGRWARWGGERAIVHPSRAQWRLR